MRQFGYVKLTARQDTLLLRAGESIPAHEFHYWQSDAPGDAFTAQKPGRTTSWAGGYGDASTWLGFPHIHLCAQPKLAERFLARCQEGL